MSYRLSLKAADDIEDIYVVGARMFGVTQAERYFVGLAETLQFLADYPGSARLRPELGGQVRAHAYRSHVIFFRRLEVGDILVLRVRHGRQDWSDPEALA